MKYVIAYDIGTTGVKTCVFSIDKKIELLASANASYPLFTLSNGGAEQEPDDWWNGMITTTKKVFANIKIKPSQIDGISFCSQMQALVLVDKEGNAVRRSMSYMDQRATEEVKKGISYGLQIAGANIFKLIPSLRITGAVTSSPKDPVWKYKWVEAHEPEVFKKVYKWLDVKDYLICRCTSKFTMTEDSAFSTLIFDNRPNKMCFSKKMCKMFGINMAHLPTVIKSTDCVGGLTKKAAKDLGLVEGTKVFGGGGDSSLIGVGAGCVEVGDTHIYCGTSGWVSTIVNKRKVDTSAMIAAITGVETGKYNYFAEMETAGKCLEWVRDHLARDEIILYLHHHKEFKDYASKNEALYRYLNEKINSVKPGAGGVIFTPWLHGNRCPFEDAKSTGMFFGLKIETGKTELIRSVMEGVYFHLRWMLECQAKKIPIKDTVRFVGGGAISSIACQMVADILGKKVETVHSPQNVGAVGAAAIIGVGIGAIPKIEDVRNYIPVAKTYEPIESNHVQYEPYFQLFKKLYKSNKNNFRELHDKSASANSNEGLKQGIKFFLFSCSAGIIQLLFTTVFGLISGMPVSASYLIGLVASVIWNFTFNRKFTFKSANNIPKAMALAFLFYLFFAPASVTFSAYLTNGDWLSLFQLPSFLGILDTINIPKGGELPLGATLVTTVICMIFNLSLEFPWQKFVVFRKKKDKKDSKKNRELKNDKTKN